MVSISLAAFLAASCVAGCKDKPGGQSQGQAADTDDADPIRMSDNSPPVIVFPPELRTDDPALNRFIDAVLGYCVRGEYGYYRLTVASQYDPVPKQHFERAWHAVKEVRVRKVKKVYDPTTRPIDPSRTDLRPELKGPIYCAHATITLRDVRRSRPVREVVVLLVQENGEWKLGPPAPPALKHQITGTTTPTDDLVSPVGGHEDQPSSQPASAPAGK